MLLGLEMRVWSGGGDCWGGVAGDRGVERWGGSPGLRGPLRLSASLGPGLSLLGKSVAADRTVSRAQVRFGDVVGGVGLAQALADDPVALVVLFPDDNRLVVRTRDDAPPLAAAPAGRDRGTQGFDVARVAGPGRVLRVTCPPEGSGAEVHRRAGTVGVPELVVDGQSLQSHRLLGARGVPETGLDGPDQVEVAPETGDLGARDVVKDAHGVIVAAADDAPVIELHAGDALLVADQGLLARAAAEAPNLDQPIAGRGDDLVVADLDGVDGRPVSL